MKKIIVISDFDGTITQRDSLVEILNNFADPSWHVIAKLVRSGKIGTKIGLKKEMALCRVSKKEYVSFLKKKINIDSTFKNFLEFCKKNKIKFITVSGGFGLNIKVVFSRYGLKHIPYYANIISFKGKKVKVKYPYRYRGCKDCGHCKAPYITLYKKRGYITVYVGDSVTDHCPARVADLVFAKHRLAEYCEAKGIEFVPYNTFGDIKTYLSSKICRGE